MRPKEELETTANRRVYRRRYKEITANCTFCRWHRGENASRKPIHGHRKLHKIQKKKP